jgi:uroporphyrinogen-III synthase
VTDTGRVPRVLVTRPAGQADGLLAALRAGGWQVAHLPLIAIEALDPLPPAARQRILDLDRYAHVIFVSANAARIGLEHMLDLWPQWPAQQRYWAVGASTAATLEAAGLRADSPASDMSSEGLLAMPGLVDVGGEACLLVRGEGGRTKIADTLRERGARVDELPCYRRDAVEYGQADMDELLRGGPIDLLLVSSGEGLEQLSRLLRPREGTNLAGTTLIAPSPRVASRARELGWRRVDIAENASDQAMLLAAERWREQRPGETQH